MELGIPVRREAYDLMHRGTLLLAEMERNGIRIDTPRLESEIERVSKKMRFKERAVKATPIWKAWQRKYGSNANLGSHQQLATILQSELGHVDERGKTDEKALSQIDDPFVVDFLELKKLWKLHGTYLTGIRREVDHDGYLHAFFGLLQAVTYRSNSSDPNFQNVPIRNKRIGRIIRSCFVPRPGRALVEIDLSGAEVRVAACYNKDPVLIEYILDPSKDMHRDMAAECYKCLVEDVSKQMRYAGKNMFVFPEFYGSWYEECSKNLWEYITIAELELVDGTKVHPHLKAKGIKNFKQFKEHIKKVEDGFWNQRFAVYTEWKNEWWANYLKRGWFETLTGFVCQGVMAKNDAINYPIQGSAFQCLLWSAIKVKEQIKRRRMETLLIGQIHDSILADVPLNELDDYVGMVVATITKKLRYAMPWLIVPLEVDVEYSDVNWHEKKTWKGKE